ncbi:MAG: tetratricopeptide repeat protein [Candidatus Sumerlaeaceae bacterium]|nr:tetratricopeptide repeat protein [Candidatus Sumerlaeaceae bacterium]
MMRPLFVRAVYASACVVIVLAATQAYTGFFSRLSFVRATRGHQSEAEHEARLRRAIALDPSNGYAYLRLAALQIRRGRHAEALETQRTGMTTFRTVRGFVQHGSIYERLGEHGQARQIYRMVMRIDPGNLDALERLAAIAFRNNDPVALENHCSRILQINPENVNALYLLARDAERQGNLNAAFNYLVRVSTILSRTTVPDSRKLFTTKDIEDSLRDLRAKLAAS